MERIDLNVVAEKYAVIMKMMDEVRDLAKEMVILHPDQESMDERVEKATDDFLGEIDRFTQDMMLEAAGQIQTEM